MQTYLVKLTFRSPLHIGRGVGNAYDVGERVLHSDTISGALAAVYAQWEPTPDVPGFMRKYRLSSAFPFVRDVLFLPRPLLRSDIKLTDSDEDAQKKKIKKIEYLELDLWKRLVRGEGLEVNSCHLTQDGRFLYAEMQPPSSIDSSEARCKKCNAPGGHRMIRITSPYSDELQQRLFVPREGKDTMPYYIERRYFAEDSGLYFFLDTDSKDLPLIESCLKMLGESGFGTDKSVGNGQFKYVIQETEKINITLGEKLVLLSLTVPERTIATSQVLTNSAYRLLPRGGFMAGTSNDSYRHLRKKSVMMLVEGSVLDIKRAEGKILDVTPQWNDPDFHKVYRDGRAYYVNVNI